MILLLKLVKTNFLNFFKTIFIHFLRPKEDIEVSPDEKNSDKGNFDKKETPTEKIFDNK